MLAAAADVLSESGLKAPVEEVARRAGVGVGTVCRNFPTKQALVDAVLADCTRRCSTTPSPAWPTPIPATRSRRSSWCCRRSRPGTGPSPSRWRTRCEPPTAPPEARERLWAAISELVARAQAVGAVRADIGPADVALLLSGVAHATAVAGDLQPVLRERYVRIILDGLRPHGASELPGEPLDFARLQHLKQQAKR